MWRQWRRLSLSCFPRVSSPAGEHGLGSPQAQWISPAPVPHTGIICKSHSVGTCNRSCSLSSRSLARLDWRLRLTLSNSSIRPFQPSVILPIWVLYTCEKMMIVTEQGQKRGRMTAQNGSLREWEGRAVMLKMGRDADIQRFSIVRLW